MINYLHELLPQVKKLFYFSDGSGGQYKNYKNLKKKNAAQFVREMAETTDEKKTKELAEKS